MHKTLYTYILVIKSLFGLCNLINIKPSFIEGRVLGVHFTQMCIMHHMEKLFSSYAAKFWFLRFFCALYQKIYIYTCYSA